MCVDMGGGSHFRERGFSGGFKGGFTGCSQGDHRGFTKRGFCDDMDITC